MQRLRACVRDAVNAAAARIPASITAMETAVMAIGRAVSLNVDRAREQVADADAVQQSVTGDAGIVAALSGLAEMTSGFLAELVPRMRAQAETTHRAAQHSQKIRAAGKKIDAIAFAARMLNLNAQIEAARLGALGEPFMVIVSRMVELTHQIEEANRLIGELAETLAADLPAIASTGESVAETCEDFSGKFSARVAGVRRVQADVQERLRDTSERMQSRAGEVLRTGQETLTHLQFQDPVAQSLRQVERSLATVLAVVEGTAVQLGLDDGGVPDTHNPVEVLRASAAAANAAPAAEPALASGDVLLF
jgi:methyl-accepting chemotaxis protein